MKNRWKIKESKIVYKNPWLKVVEARGLRPDGDPGIHAYIVEKDSVAVVPVTREGKIVLIKEHRFAVNKALFAVPCGSIEEGLPPLEAAQIELKEETGYEADSWKELGYFHVSPSLTTEKVHVFFAKDIRKGKPDREGTEQIEVKEFSVEEIKNMLFNSGIVDAFGFIPLVLALQRLSKLKTE